MIERNIKNTLVEVSQSYPVVTVTGPRQSGKTTLCKMAFPGKPLVSLEPLDVREWARSDPRSFLAKYRQGAIFDEVQHLPELLSYLQVEVDERPEPGRFVLSGSQHVGLTASVAQSLAGRTGMLTLLPLSLDEIGRFPKVPRDLWEVLWTGAYPRIHDQRIHPPRWLADYLLTYVERDVRQVLQVGDLDRFAAFVRLCAGRTGQLLNLSSLGSDAGISHNTARSWLSVLQAGFLIHMVPAYAKSIKSQQTKAPKLHFLDAGLACHLLGVREPEQLATHPLRGNLFESFVVSEVCKWYRNRGEGPPLFHFRDHKGLEVDLLLEGGARVLLIEAKSGSSVAADFFGPLERIRALLAAKAPPGSTESLVVYGGAEEQIRSAGRVVPWERIPEQDWLV